MATVEVTFTPLPAHVRTARLVATAVARRSGVDEALLDEVRLDRARASLAHGEPHLIQQGLSDTAAPGHRRGHQARGTHMGGQGGEADLNCGHLGG